MVWRAEGALGGGGAGAGGPSGAEQHRRSRRSPRLEARGVRSEQPPASPRLAQNPAPDTPSELGVQEISLTHHVTKRDRGGLGLIPAMQRAKLEPPFSPGSYLFSF